MGSDTRGAFCRVQRAVSMTVVLSAAVLAAGCDGGKSEAPTADSASTAAAKSSGSAAPAKPKAPESPFSIYAEGTDLRLAGSFRTVAGLYVGAMLFPVDDSGVSQIEGSMRVGGPRNSSWSSYAIRVTGSWPERAFAITKGGDADTINLWKPNEKRNSWFADVRGGSDRDPLLDADLYIESGMLGMQSLGDFDWKFWFAHPLKAKIVTKPSPGTVTSPHVRKSKNSQPNTTQFAAFGAIRSTRKGGVKPRPTVLIAM